MNHDPFHWGRPSTKTYGEYNYLISNASNVDRSVKSNSEFPKMHTQQPMITGTSVIAIKYKDGIIMAADHMGSYGSLMKLEDLKRIIQVGDDAVVGISGDISDFQYLERLLDDLQIEDAYDMDQEHLKANHLSEYLTRVMYNRRTKMNPLWNAIIVAGFDDKDEPYLKHIDLLGVSYTSPTLATGFGNHLAIPLLRKKVETEDDVKKLSKEDAIQTIKDCMKVLFYRDARSWNKYSLCVIEKSTKSISLEHEVQVENMKWDFAQHITGYGVPQL
ncbi:proteasome core particle subunit beta 7 [Pichia kluyveri]|uniref:Proteasome subunit beta n=1 Tax=Pichia kluyveri TaxID=36015 RepID=A0AAV5R9M4_PICKL|nr:proteasome core particle subunit beta 7 [Pichia kluyveri]